MSDINSGAAPRDVLPASVPVLVVGAGPVGLTLALELERQGVDVLVVERNSGPTRHPKMDITNGRSMELFRQLGVADDLRKVAVARHHEMSVRWVTGLQGWELASFTYPSVDAQAEAIAAVNDGTLTAEPNMRVSQILLEPTLRDAISSRARHAQVRYGWALESYEQDGDGVRAVLRSSDTGEEFVVQAQYLAGCDGARSRVRETLNIGLDEVDVRRLVVKELGVRSVAAMTIRAFLQRGERPANGNFYMIHFTTNDARALERFGTSWHIQSPEGWVLISQDGGPTWTLHVPLGIGDDPSTIDPATFVQQTLGATFDLQVHVANAWTPRLVVANGFGRGRVWIAGDAAHQVPPTGGYGMNTGVGDAVALGWALAASVQGWAGSGLLPAYEAERRSVALRNREAAQRHTVVRLAIKAALRGSEKLDSWKGVVSRQRLGRIISDLGNLENEAAGIEYGYRYDGSPVICDEDGTAPMLHLDRYQASTWPGSRPPSVGLADGRSVFDLFGSGFTLLRFSDADVTGFVRAADLAGLPLTVVDIDDHDCRILYERDLVLVRPDQHVAWRGDLCPADPEAVLDRVRGAGAGTGSVATRHR